MVKPRRRTSGWQGDSPTLRAFPSVREQSGHDSDEDFGPLANRNFFPATSSTGFSQDDTRHDCSTFGPLHRDDAEGASPTGRSATTQLGEWSVHESSLYLDSHTSGIT